MTDEQIETVMLGLDEVLLKLGEILAVLEQEALNITKDIDNDSLSV